MVRSSPPACVSVQHTNLIPLSDKEEAAAAAAAAAAASGGFTSGGSAVGGTLPRGVAWVPAGTPGEQFEVSASKVRGKFEVSSR